MYLLLDLSGIRKTFGLVMVDDTVRFYDEEYDFAFSQNQTISSLISEDVATFDVGSETEMMISVGVFSQMVTVLKEGDGIDEFFIRSEDGVTFPSNEATVRVLFNDAQHEAVDDWKNSDARVRR